MTVPVHPVPLAGHVGTWFTGRPAGDQPPPVGQAGNVSARRPHDPATLARTRREATARMGLTTGQLRWMRQVHGNRVGWASATQAPGAELRGIDAVVTADPDVALCVQVADCVPVLIAGDRHVAAVHAGRRGVETDVVGETLAALEAAGVPVAGLRAIVGPAIGGCCYEVPDDLRHAVASRLPVAAAETTWGTPSLDLPAAVTARLNDAGLAKVARFGGCTRCDPQHRWFSHRADPRAGRQIGVIVRRGEA